jgi:hypothetical protein
MQNRVSGIRLTGSTTKPGTCRHSAERQKHKPSQVAIQAQAAAGEGVRPCGCVNAATNEINAAIEKLNEKKKSLQK